MDEGRGFAGDDFCFAAASLALSSTTKLFTSCSRLFASNDGAEARKSTVTVEACLEDLETDDFDTVFTEDDRLQR